MRSIIRSSVVLVALSYNFLFAPAPSQAGCSTELFPSVPPSALWDVLTPYTIATSGLGNRLSMMQGGDRIYNAANPTWLDADYAAGFLLVSGDHGWDFFDVSDTSKKEAPVRIYVMQGWGGNDYPGGVGDPSGTPLGFSSNDARELAPRSWAPYGEIDDWGGDAAMKSYVHAGRSKVFMASTGDSPDVGMTVWEFDPELWRANPGTSSHPGAAPKIIYAMKGTTFTDLSFVNAKNGAGQDQLYLYASAQDNQKIYIFNISSAADSPCLGDNQIDIFANDQKQGSSSCSTGSTVFKGSISGATHHIDTVDRSGSSPAYLVSGQRSGGAVLYSLANATAPVSRGRVRDNEGSASVRSVAIWRAGSSIGVASQDISAGLLIHDVTTCATSSSCNGTADRRFQDGSLRGTFDRIRTGQVGGSDYLWIGENRSCSGRQNKEALLSVGSLSNVTDISPSATTSIGGVSVNFFTYFYPENPSGFRFFQPSGAAFSEDGYLFRALYRAIDSSLIDDPEPSVTLTGPTTAFLTDNNVYTASFDNCTPTGPWTWTTQQQGSGGVNIQNNGSTATMTWDVGFSPTSDVVQVSHPDCADDSLAVTIADPVPDIQQVRLNGSIVPEGGSADITQCELGNFTTTTVGRAPLTYDWSMTPAGATSATDTLGWSVGDAIGAQTLLLNVNNTSGSDSFTATIDVDAIGNPDFSAPPSVDQVGQAGNFTVSANSLGTSEWQWEVRPLGGTFIIEEPFGTGVENQSFSLDTGTWEIQATVRNCLDSGVTATSDVVQVVVVADPPVAVLEVDISTCTFLQGSICFSITGMPVGFNNLSTGDITTYQYDLDHTGTTLATCDFGGGSSTPTNTFTYPVANAYRPCVRVTGPGGVSEALASLEVRISGPPIILFGDDFESGSTAAWN